MLNLRYCITECKVYGQLAVATPESDEVIGGSSEIFVQRLAVIDRKFLL